MIQESEEIALLREENARLRAQLAIATAGHASAVQGAGASDQDPFDAQVADQKTLFSDFIEHLPIGLCLVGKGGKVLMSNPAYRHFLPDTPIPSLLSAEEDRGRWRSWDKDGKPVPRDQFVAARAFRGELVVPGVDCVYDTPQGLEVWTRVFGVPLRNADKEVVATAIAILDIDAERRALDMLRQSEERLDALVRSSSEVRYSISADWSELHQLAGGGFIPDTQASNTNWLEDYIPPEDRDLVRAEIARAIRTKTDYVIEHRVNRVDGSVGWAFSRAVPLFDAAGAITGWLGAASDITERKQAQAALERLNATLEEQVAERTADRNALWQLSSDIMMRCTFEGIITAVNPAWTEVLGWREDELLGTTLFHLIHPEDLARTIQDTQELATGMAHARFDNRYRHRDGSYRWISWSTRSAAGRINAVGRDITSEMAKAEALAKVQEQLRQSQKMEAVGQLTGGLAHDFNNLLAAVMGNLELLQRMLARGQVDNLTRFIHGAQGAVRRAATLTQRLLAFSRRQILDSKPTDMAALLADWEDLLRRTVGASVDIDIVPAAHLWHAQIDGTQLENAILNLCINARDAMPEGGRLTIRTANIELEEAAAREWDLPPGGYVSLCVTDTGTGMSEQTIARAFEPFYTTKPVGHGTGLGLSMIYGFARQSGGAVRIFSQPGQGTTVCLYLPRCDAAPVAERAVDTARHVVVPAQRTLLVVDDEAPIRHLIDEALVDLGYTVLAVADAAAALQVLRAGTRVDMLITDMRLRGGMNGKQLADEARLARSDLPVLFITGFTEASPLSQENLHPGTQLLTKPFTLEALSLKVAEILGSNDAVPSD
ncbi:hybrid sensor histidine kinase/response regulator [Delftia lacustris]|uniref:histidine kinase n=1 Tax=Delftia lacustris TaxID=558537 RepID=A0A1H3NRT6_9BURK|nr:PAS domain S-box protein [Delftia lacustris]SDY91612.1 PAS/PAC sensor hybrid histidine kinase [Delftia lacustris]